MRPVKRHAVNKSGSAAQFRHHSRRTKAPNMMRVMRGGIRF